MTNSMNSMMGKITLILTDGEKTKSLTMTVEQLETLGKSVQNKWESKENREVVDSFIQLAVNEYWPQAQA